MTSQSSTKNGTGMTHLPECWASEPTDPEAWCICDELRTCEQRVRIESQAWHYKQGYADGLRDAVEAVKLSCSADIELVERTEVIAVIEALKEKP